MKPFYGIAAIAATIVTSALLIAQTTGELFTHTVKKSESISLICIDYYGHYSKKLGQVIKTENPDIKDINLIFPGQKIKLHKPLEAAGGTRPVTPIQPAIKDSAKVKDSTKTAVTAESPDSLFVKKMNIVQGVVTCVVGTVNYKAANTGAFKPLTVNTILNPGDIIETSKNGRVEIIINRESVVRMKENTRMNLEAFRDTLGSKDKTKLGFSNGTIWTKMKKFKDRLSRFELELPTAVAGVHGTVYETTVSPDKSSEVKVFTGEVRVSGVPSQQTQGQGPGVNEVAAPHEIPGPHEVSLETWVKIITDMQKITVAKDGKPSEPETFTQNPSSDWEKWNQDRDKRIAEMFMEQQ
jgi:hypothetical protein